jgi:hypothetical protein
MAPSLTLKNQDVMKKKFILGIVLVLVVAVLWSCSNMSVGMGISVGAGPYGVCVSPTFNVGFSGGHYW